MIIKKSIILILTFTTFSSSGNAIDFNYLMKGNPIITISNDVNGKLESVTAYSVTDAPFEILWNTILDIKSYKEYTPGIKEIKNIRNDDKENKIMADFEIEVPFSNLKYCLSYKYDFKNRTIEVIRHSGDLEGSHWLWKFEKIGDSTLIVYSGLIKNFSSLLEYLDDSTNSMTMGVNISTIISTVKINKERAELIYKNSQDSKK